jgi:hypothetical protein
MMTGIRILRILPALAVAPVAAFGCGGSGSTGFGSSNGSPSSSAPNVDASTLDDAAIMFPGSSDGSLVIQPGTRSDGAVVVTQSICKAGVYEGKFMTFVGSGADGGSPGIFSEMWNGSLSIDLTAKKITIMSASGSGENFTTTDTSRLEIAEGGALEGGDTMGGTFFADLDGELDCDPDAGQPYHLTATLFNGAYKNGFLSIMMAGNLSADYQASSPPMLVNGAILTQGILTDGGAPFASASGTWSATWTSP